jgi:NADH-quinone oxidoreductase subunit E
MSTANAKLTPAELAAIADLVAHAPTPRAACIDALKFIQSTRRNDADDVLPDIAAALGMSTAELDEVATFYNLIFRKPVGETVILLCDSISCWILGSGKLAAQITDRLHIQPGETTADQKFTLLPIVCLGACDHAPALMLGGTLHGDVTPARLDALLEML